MESALKILRLVGLPRSWPTVKAVELAIEAEASFSGVSVEEAAQVISKAACEYTRAPLYSVPANWETRDIFRLNLVDRFWFEDARWRAKFAYAEFQGRLEQARTGDSKPDRTDCAA